MFNAFRTYIKQLSCKHEWEYVGKVPQIRNFYSNLYFCHKCGKFKDAKESKDDAE